MDLGEHRPAILAALHAGCARSGRARPDEVEAERLISLAIAQFKRERASREFWKGRDKEKLIALRKRLADAQAALLALIDPELWDGRPSLTPAVEACLAELAELAPPAPTTGRPSGSGQLRRFTELMAAVCYQITGAGPSFTELTDRDGSPPPEGPFLDFALAAAPLAGIDTTARAIASEVKSLRARYRMEPRKRAMPPELGFALAETVQDLEQTADEPNADGCFAAALARLGDAQPD